MKKNEYAEMNSSTIQRYTSRFEQYGYAKETLGWNKGKQFERFHQLTHSWDLEGHSILDVGCGFGDFLDYLKNMSISPSSYHGIDLTPVLIETAQQRHVGENITFSCGDFITEASLPPADYVFASGIFNFKNENIDSYKYLLQSMKWMYKKCNIAFSLDLLSDKVDFQHAHTAHYSPGKVLEMAYSFSRNIELKNNYFPFEFALIVNKDDSFLPETTMFNTTIQKLVSNSIDR